MKFSDFNNIIIEQEKGVSEVSGDTFLITNYAATLPPQKTLEVGCGTGFTSVYLSSLGFAVTASDINSKAILLTQHNAQLNGLNFDCIKSNLFSQISEKFDLILFNPPYGNTNSSLLAPLLEFIKSLVPRNNSYIEKIVYGLISKKRLQLLELFLEQAPKYLSTNGIILLLIHNKELTLGQKYNAQVVGEWKHMLLVRIETNSV